MIGLLLMVLLVSVVYEVLIAAVVITGTRWRWSEGRWPEAGRSLVSPPVGGGGEGASDLVRLRASALEREVTGTRISDAMADGRLSLEEGVERLDAAYGARERAQLEALVADLPSRRVSMTRPARRPVERGSGLPSAVVVVVVAAVLAQAAAGIWILWPVAVALLLAQTRRRQL